MSTHPILPADLESLFQTHDSDPNALLTAFMPLLCNHIHADRIFLQPRNPITRVCKILTWRRNDSIPWAKIPGDISPNTWFIEQKWEDEDPLWRAALHLKPSIYITSLPSAAASGLLNIDFENEYMFHTAFIHGHAHLPPLSPSELTGQGNENKEVESPQRQFYGSVQPAVFDGPRDWTPEVRELMEACLVRIAPFMKVVGEGAPRREELLGKGK